MLRSRKLTSLGTGLLGDRLVLIAGTHFFFLFFKGGYGGRIINIASVAGIMPMAKTIEHSSYTVAKHGVVALTRSFVPAAFPKRSIHIRISNSIQILSNIIKDLRLISFLHTHKEAHYKVPKLP